MTMLLPSCDGRTGYLEDNQEAIIDNLAASEWILMREESKIFGTKTYEKESRIYQFDDNGKGWTAWAAMSDGTLLTEPVHFRWAFTTPEFTVFQTTGNSIEGYWLIQKLTASEFQAQWTPQDPVLYPNQDKTIYKLAA